MDAAITSRPDGAIGLYRVSKSLGQGKTLKPTQPWKQDCWVIPPDKMPSLFCQMESVLQVYQQRYHPDFPVILMKLPNNSSKLLSQLPQSQDNQAAGLQI